MSCKSTLQDKSMLQKVFGYHIGVVENFNESRYIDDDSSLRRSIDFLERTTKIKSEFTEQYVMLYTPSKKNIKDWKKWFKKNQKTLYWDEKNGEVKPLK